MSSSTIGNLPMPAKLGALGIGAAGLLGAGWIAARNIGFVLILLAGLILVALLVAGVFWLRKKLGNKKSVLLAREIPAGTPTGINKADQIARLEALRREFEKALEKFRTAGRSLYSTPWFLLVGEPGGGKTEAIRHSQVRFIPGLQDPLQGVGGTLNMNWWFTRDAIILDTAGRIMFEDVEAGSGSEWDEMLSLLKTNRKDCPINGLLLVIPADTLLTDTPAEINRKASRIAGQFEHLQQTLGVRFPVFVTITKCDLLGGFNEFFDNLKDEQQNQIMGWSNPNPLDSEFDPTQVDDHLRTVRERLVRRRLRRLLEPARGEDGVTRRMDQMDAMYSLPDNLMMLAPRLRQYLETVFVAGTWSQKPLFLRGIYFSSSLQKGSPLDPDLAQAMGIPLKDLPKGPEVDEKRTFFLRDLFMEKVFAEKGLVTRVLNVDALQRKRRMVVMGGGVVASLALLGFVVWQFYQFEKNLGRFLDYKTIATAQDAGLKAGKWGIVDKTGRYQGQEKHGGDLVGLPWSLDRSRRLLDDSEALRASRVFVGSLVGTPLPELQKQAHGKLVESSLTAPLVRSAQYKMEREDAQRWDAPATEALKRLIRSATAVAATQPSGGVAASATDLDPLFGYVLAGSKDDQGAFKKDSDEHKIPAVYLSAPGWPVDKASLKKTIDHGVGVYIAYCDTKTKEREQKIGAIETAQAALSELKKAEDQLALLPGQGAPATLTAYNALKTEWSKQLGDVRAKAAAADAALKALAGMGWTATKPLGALFDEAVKESQASAIGEIRAVLDTIPATPPDVLVDARTKLDAEVKKAELRQEALAKSKAREELEQLDRWMVSGAERTAVYAYQGRVKLLEGADAVLASAETSPGTFDVLMYGFGDGMREFGEGAKKSVDTLSPVGAAAAEPLAKNALTVAKFVVNQMALPRRRHAALTVLADNAPAAEDRWVALASAEAKKTGGKLRRAVPGTTWEGKPDDFHDLQFTPDVVGRLNKSWVALMAEVDSPEGVLDRADLKRKLDERNGAWGAFVKSYKGYWSGNALKQMRFAAGDWTAMSKQLAATNGTVVNIALGDVSRDMYDALAKIDDAQGAQAMTALGTRLADGTFRSLCDQVMGKWRALPGAPDAAREQLLNAQASSFTLEYTFPAQLSTESPLIAAYWGELPKECITRLADAVQAGIPAKVRELMGLQRFPLVLRDAGNRDEQDLTREELERARALVKEIRGLQFVSKGTLGDTDPPERTFSAEFTRLRGSLNPDQKTILEGVDKIVSAIPEQELNVVIRFVKGQFRNAGGSAELVRIKLDEKEALINYRAPGRPERDMIAVTLPARGVLRFDFFNGELNAQADKKIPVPQLSKTFPGPWAVLRMVHEQGKLVSADPKTGEKWQVTLKVEEGVDLVLDVEVQTDRRAKARTAIPDVSEWPTRSAGARAAR